MINSKKIKKDLKEEEIVEDIEKDLAEQEEQEEEKIEAPKKKKVLNENQKRRSPLI